MTKRERLEIVAQFVETLAPPMGPSDAAALRELDQLLADVAAYLPIGKQWAEGEALIKRLAQAGYGEK